MPRPDLAWKRLCNLSRPDLVWKRLYDMSRPDLAWKILSELEQCRLSLIKMSLGQHVGMQGD